MIDLPTNPLKPLLIHGDAFSEIQRIPSCSIDSIIVDFPYFLGDEGFMSLNWDRMTDSTPMDYTNLFKQCARVLKPGGKMLYFTGAINFDLFGNWARSAGFNILPMIAWVYSSGMPHGLNVVKYLIKQDHLDRVDSWKIEDFTLVKLDYTLTLSKNGKTKILTGVVPKEFQSFIKYHNDSNKSSKNLLLSKIRYLHAEYFTHSVISYEKSPSDEYPSGMKYTCLFRDRMKNNTVLEGEWTDLMERYDGFNSALKPAIEPIGQLEKPLSESSIVKNIIRWGTGTYNINACRIPLAGMRNVDVNRFIRQLKMDMNWIEREKIEIQNVDMDKTMSEVQSMSQSRDSTDHVYTDNIRDRLNSGGGATLSKETLNDVKEQMSGQTRFGKCDDHTFTGEIRDGLNSGGGAMLSKEALTDIISQVGGGNRRAKGKEKRGYDNGKVLSKDIGDAMNGGGRAVVDGDIDNLLKDLKTQIVGYNKKLHVAKVMDKNHADHLPHNNSSDQAKELVKFIKGSHPMHGSSGSGIHGYNKGKRTLKADTDKTIKAARGIHRKVNWKKSGSGIHEFNKEKDLSEEELRSLEKDLKDQTTRHDPTKHKGALFGNGDMPMDNKNYSLMTFFDKLLGRYPCNVISCEEGAFNNAVMKKGKKGTDYDKIFLVGKPTPKEKLSGIPEEMKEDFHKTVKPRRLMQHLIKLVTPRGGIVLDCMAGSGTTLVEAKANNYLSIGIEIDKTYYDIMVKRLENINAAQRSLW